MYAPSGCDPTNRRDSEWSRKRRPANFFVQDVLGDMRWSASKTKGNYGTSLDRSQESNMIGLAPDSRAVLPRSKDKMEPDANPPRILSDKPTIWEGTEVVLRQSSLMVRPPSHRASN